jgi:hypothetical protein
MENNDEAEIPKEVVERFDLAYKISKELVEELKLPDIRERKYREFSNKTDCLHKLDIGDDITVYPEVNTCFGYINFNFSLGSIAYDAIWLIQLILSDEKFPEVVKPTVSYQLKKAKIDVLKLFDLEKSEVQEVIELHAKGVLRMFLANIQNFTESAIIDAYGHSKIG